MSGLGWVRIDEEHVALGFFEDGFHVILRLTDILTHQSGTIDSDDFSFGKEPEAMIDLAKLTGDGGLASTGIAREDRVVGLFTAVVQSSPPAFQEEAALIGHRTDALFHAFKSYHLIELTDAPEDSAYYTAVRFAFEEGLMAPAEENAFGVDQPATVGDLAGAIYVLIGGSLGDAQEAIATLGAYGIVSPDAQADTALTQGDADAILVNLMAAMGAEGAYTPSAENADLPLTRGALAELLHTLFSE